MQDEQDFYRCLASDAASRALRNIQEILADVTLDDPECFHRIEAIVSLLDIRLRNALPAVLLGLVIAGGITTAVTLGVIHLF